MAPWQRSSEPSVRHSSEAANYFVRHMLRAPILNDPVHIDHKVAVYIYLVHMDHKAANPVLMMLNLGCGDFDR